MVKLSLNGFNTNPTSDGSRESYLTNLALSYHVAEIKLQVTFLGLGKSFVEETPYVDLSVLDAKDEVLIPMHRAYLDKMAMTLDCVKNKYYVSAVFVIERKPNVSNPTKAQILENGKFLRFIDLAKFTNPVGLEVFTNDESYSKQSYEDYKRVNLRKQRIERNTNYGSNNYRVRTNLR